MKKANALSSSILSIALLAGCGSPKAGTDSAIKEFENSSLDEYRRFVGQQSIVAEYTPDQDVIISLYIVEDLPDLPRALLEAGTRKVYVVLEKSPGAVIEGNGERAERLKAKLESDLGPLFSRVEFVNHGSYGPWYKDPAVTVDDRLDVWTRDGGPIATRTKDGTLRLVDFNYRADGSDANDANDYLPTLFAAKLGVERISVPIDMWGGAFMASNDGDCFTTGDTTSRLLTEEFIGKDSIERAVARSEEVVTTHFKEILGCKRVFFLAANIPENGLNHVDLWAKIIADKVVLVNELRDEAIDSFRRWDGFEDDAALKGTYVEEMRKLQGSLNASAKKFQSWGYRVVRIPSPAVNPIVTDLTYANSLIVGESIIVPSYAESNDPSMPYWDAALLPKYEAEVRTTLETEGFKVFFVNSDKLVGSNGKVHCVTMQIPSKVSTAPAAPAPNPVPVTTSTPAHTPIVTPDLGSIPPPADSSSATRDASMDSFYEGNILRYVELTLSGREHAYNDTDFTDGRLARLIKGRAAPAEVEARCRTFHSHAASEVGTRKPFAWAFAHRCLDVSMGATAEQAQEQLAVLLGGDTRARLGEAAVRALEEALRTIESERPKVGWQFGYPEP